MNIRTKRCFSFVWHFGNTQWVRERPGINQLTSQPQRGLVVKSSETWESRLGKKGGRRLSYVPAVCFWEVTGSLVPGRGGRQPGVLFPSVNHSLFKVGFSRELSGYPPLVCPSIFSLQALTIVDIDKYFGGCQYLPLKRTQRGDKGSFTVFPV